MTEKIGNIKNPLTVIAIFAGIAEVSGSAVLPFISPCNQGLYIWFLMGFPTLLVLLFFGTLIFKHRVFYAPSDFRDDRAFTELINAFRPASSVMIQQKLTDEVSAEVREEAHATDTADATVIKAPVETKIPIAGGIESNTDINLKYSELRNKLSKVEDLVFETLSKERGIIYSRNVTAVATTGLQITFDGLDTSNDRVSAVEVKYIRRTINLDRIRLSLAGIQDYVNSYPESVRRRFSYTLVVVLDEEAAERKASISTKVATILHAIPLQTELRIFTYAELKTLASK